MKILVIRKQKAFKNQKICLERIFQKRREKMLKLCGGVSRIKTNIKTVNEFRPEKLVYERECKRVSKNIVK